LTISDLALKIKESDGLPGRVFRKSTQYLGVSDSQPIVSVKHCLFNPGTFRKENLMLR